MKELGIYIQVFKPATVIPTFSRQRGKKAWDLGCWVKAIGVAAVI